MPAPPAAQISLHTIIQEISELEEPDVLILSNKLVSWLAQTRRDFLNIPEVEKLWESQNLELAKFHLSQAEKLLPEQQQLIDRISQVELNQNHERHNENSDTSSKSRTNSDTTTTDSDTALSHQMSYDRKKRLIQADKYKTKPKTSKSKLTTSVDKIFNEYKHEVNARQKFVSQVEIECRDYYNKLENLNTCIQLSQNQNKKLEKKSEKNNLKQIHKHSLHVLLNNSINLKNFENQKIYEFQNLKRKNLITKYYMDKYLVIEEATEEEHRYLSNIISILINFEVFRTSVDINKQKMEEKFAENILKRIIDLDYKNNLKNLKLFDKKSDNYKNLKQDLSNCKHLCQKYLNWSLEGDFEAASSQDHTRSNSGMHKN